MTRMERKAGSNILLGLKIVSCELYGHEIDTGAVLHLDRPGRPHLTLALRFRRQVTQIPGYTYWHYQGH